MSVLNGATLSNFGRDRLGSLTGLTSTTQTLSGSWTYQPWGAAVGGTGNSADTNLRFTGARRDTGTGFTQMGVRTYSYPWARFTQPDPLPSSITDINRYAYAGCNPTNFIDPTGTSHCSPDDIATKGAYATAGVLTVVGVVILGASTFGLALLFGFGAGLAGAASVYAIVTQVREASVQAPSPSWSVIPGILAAYPTLRAAAELVGISPSTLSRRKGLQYVARGYERRLTPATVLELGKFYRRRPLGQIASDLLDYAFEHAPDFGEQADAEIEAALGPAPTTLDSASFLSEARRALPQQLYAAVERAYRDSLGDATEFTAGGASEPRSTAVLSG